MTKCKFCEDQTEYEFYENFEGKWKLGTKIDVNTFRQHICKKSDNLRFPQRKGWFTFQCIVCGYITRLSKKHFSEKDEKKCTSCRNLDI